MKKALLAFVLCAASALPTAANDTLVRFRGGIGVIPVSNVAVVGTTTTVTRNIVRGVNPPGQLWVIRDLRASVTFDGRITAHGKGLLLGGGNGIGTNAGQSVFATLICEATAPFTLRSTSVAGVAIQPNGNFDIEDVLSPAPDGGCASPVLLIRNTGGVWFAAGIEDLDD